MATITTITTPFFFRITVNCYLASTGSGYVLIDTGKSGARRAVEQALARAGCQPGDLKLIILTHGDFDHCGNAAYLRGRFGAKIAMHAADAGMPQHGDMFWQRNQPNALVRALAGRLLSLCEADRFTPDFTFEHGDTFANYDFDATVIHLPGHSSGNCGILTGDGDLFCGDLLGNLRKPEVWSLVDDAAAMAASVDKLRDLPVNMIYPGHGQPFALREFFAAQG